MEQKSTNKRKADVLDVVSKPKEAKYIRDSVHGYMEVPYDILIKLIDTLLFQRLRSIKQLSLAFLVYPGATHTRFEHSLGVMDICGKYARHLKPWDERFIKICMIAGLLHDIAHGPWSHVWDRSVFSIIYPNVKDGHDLHRIKLLHSKEFKKIFDGGDITADDIENAWSNELIKSIVEYADRIDYLARDTLHTGMTHMGVILEVGRLVACSRVKILDDHTEVLEHHEKLNEELQMFRTLREFMYKKVYKHPKVAKYELHLQRALEHLVSLDGAIINYCNDPDRFYLLTEDYVMHRILLRSESYDDFMAKIYLEINYRQSPVDGYGPKDT
jgi:HD superfamily phosphohydrolase